MSHSRRTVDALTIVVPLFGNAEEMMGAGMPYLCHYSRPIKLIPFCGKRLPTDVPGMNLSRTLLRFVCPMLLSKDHGVLWIRRRTRPSAITSGLPTGSIS